MSIQDDIFDVADAVEGTDREEAFTRICAWHNSMEQELEQARKCRSLVVQLYMMGKEVYDAAVQTNDPDMLSDGL